MKEAKRRVPGIVVDDPAYLEQPIQTAPENHPMKIVWHHPEIRQREWIRFLFYNVASAEVEDFDFDCFDDDTIHVVGMLTSPFSRTDRYFAECRRRCANLVLYDAGEDWGREGQALYQHFDNVVCEAPSLFYLSKGVGRVALLVPGAAKPEFAHRASQRRLIWSYFGDIRRPPTAMMKRFSTVPYGKVVHTNTAYSLASGAHADVLAASVFAPCGAEAGARESWRVYEALEAGSIPIIRTGIGSGRYGRLLGSHPLPTFATWGAAARFATAMMDDEAGLDLLQATVTAWWREYKLRIPSQVASMLTRSHADELRKHSARAKAGLTEPVDVFGVQPGALFRGV